MGDEVPRSALSESIQLMHKDCPYCASRFSLRQLYEAAELRVIGMAFAGNSPDCVYYYFQHAIDTCGTTFAVPAVAFSRFVAERIPEQALTGQPECERHCHNISDLQTCSQSCYYAAFRRLLVKMLALKNQNQQSSRVSVSQMSL